MTLLCQLISMTVESLGGALGDDLFAFPFGQ